MSNTINLLFAATSDYLPFVTVSAISAKKNINKNIKLVVHFFYADIVKQISEQTRNNIFEYAKYTFDENDIEFRVHNVEDKMYLFEEQNVGLWGKEISMTHYMYLLAPIILDDISQVIYLDTDMIVNCDLNDIFNYPIENYLIAMGAPRGCEEMGDDVSNSGFVVLNLDSWRNENTLADLLDFGKNLPKSRFCDQNLLYQYFTKNNPNRLLLLDKEYNLFPQAFSHIPWSDIKILHYTGWYDKKPWQDKFGVERAGFLWWSYARQTVFYEQFIMRNIPKISVQKAEKKKNLSFSQQIFSVVNSLDKKHKVITILGIKIKLRRSISSISIPRE